MSMTDRELLERAAKAAGIAITPCSCSSPRWPFKHDEAKSGKYGHWNPLTDDGDALRLSFVLSIDILHRRVGRQRVEALAPGFGVVTEIMSNADRRDAATRRAITRAAAALAPTGPVDAAPPAAGGEA